MALKYMNRSDKQDMNTSIVSDISALECGDFDMIIEHLLCKPKKSKRPKKSHHRRVHAAQSVPALNAVELFNATDEQEESAVNATFSAANTSYLSAFNDTCTTIGDEQFENIFAYFDQDVNTSELLLSDDNSDDFNDDKRHIDTPSERGNISGNLQFLLSGSKWKPKKKQTYRPKTRDIQNTSKAILNKIQQFNGIEPINSVGTTPSQTRPVSMLSTIASEGSTASLHDSDSDTKPIFKKPFDIFNRGNVRSKVAFFSDHSSSERSSSASPSIQSVSDDDEYQFQRTQSKHRFRKNCDFFENFFKDKTSDPSASSDTSTLPIEKRENKSIVNNQTSKNDERPQKIAIDPTKIDPHEKLMAVQTYVQTQHLLERIQRLISAISNLDEKRLSTMNLKLLKKFLTFIRDCSYNCTEVCNSISQHVLTDFEKNVMSAEELLYSALKDAHSAQVLKSAIADLIHTFEHISKLCKFRLFPFVNIEQLHCIWSHVLFLMEIRSILDINCDFFSLQFL